MPVDPQARAAALERAAERLDSLAEIAELMGDGANAERFRRSAWSSRLEAMDLLDR